MISLISSLGKVSSPHNLWRKIKAENAVDLELSKEQQVELKRQMWNTEVNLKDWFDRLEAFLLSMDFVMIMAPDMLSSMKNRSEGSATWARLSSQLTVMTVG
jgi:hypothetical protein